jgi:glycine cleavage system H protein
MADTIPGDLKYTKEHEWARVQGKVVVVGVTSHAQEALGDVVYVELPKVGATVTEGKQFGVIESTKAVSELYSPVTGTVVKVNDALSDNPSAVNTDPYGTGWIVEVELSDPKQVDALMDATAYSNLLKGA